MIASRQNSLKPQPLATRKGNFVKFGRVVFEICERIYRQTDRHTDTDTLIVCGTRYADPRRMARLSLTNHSEVITPMRMS